MDYLTVALHCAQWLLGFALFWRIPPCREAPVSPSHLNLSVVVPARDEEHNLPRLLDSLAWQSPAPKEVIVVDDDSSDDTAGVAAAAGAHVMPSQDLPEGWTGKAWACWQGAEQASGELLLFLDADTWLEDGALARIAAEHSKRGGLVSINPFHAVQQAYERFSAMFHLANLMGVGCFSILGQRLRPIGAFGQCMLCRREDYFAVGGHAAVRGVVIEDLALGRRFVASGFGNSCLGGRGTINYRMYPAGLGQLVEGWSKNQASGASLVALPTLFLILVWMFGQIGVARLAMTAAPSGDIVTMAVSGALYLAYSLQFWLMLRQVGRFGPLTALLYPVHVAFFIILFFYSLALTAIVRRVQWRGRSISTARRRAD